MRPNATAEAEFHKEQMHKLGYEITPFGFMHSNTLEEIYQPTEANGYYWLVGETYLIEKNVNAFLTLTTFLKSRGLEIEE